MTLSPAAEARIDDRIRRLARRSRDDTARAELRDHVAEAAEALAGKDLATPAHVDAAFAGLGSDDDVRAAFFPTRPALPVRRWEVALLILATVLASGAIIGQDGGRSTCSVSDGGTCTVSASGGVLELLVWAGPPLLVLALLYFLPAYVALAAAAVYALVAILRTIDVASIEGGAWLDTLLVLAGIVSLAVAALHLRANRMAAAG